MTNTFDKGLNPLAKDYLDFYKDAIAVVALAVAATAFEHNPTIFVQGKLAFLTTPWLFGGIAVAALFYLLAAFWTLIVAVEAKATSKGWIIAGMSFAGLTFLGVCVVIAAVLTAITK